MLPFLVTVCTITLVLVCVLIAGSLWFWPLTLHSQLQWMEEALGSLSYLQELARDQIRECHADLMRFPPWSHTPGLSGRGNHSPSGWSTRGHRRMFRPPTGVGLSRSPGTYTTRGAEPNPTLFSRLGLGADSSRQSTGSSTPVLLPMPEITPASSPTQVSGTNSTPIEPVSSPEMAVSPEIPDTVESPQPDMGLQMRRIRRSLDLRLPELARLTHLDMGRRSDYRTLQEEEKTPEAE